MKNSILILTITLLILITSGCDVNNFEVREDALENYAVEINGEWSLVSIERNKEDITGQFNFGDFILKIDGGNFNLNSTTIPFPTLKSTGNPFDSGTWIFNDDYQPTLMQLSDGTQTVQTNLKSSLYGKNNTTLKLEFSLGCKSNTYVYQFKKN